MSQAEYDYYAARSGLPATAKLEEHKRAFWAATIGASVPSDTLGELERKYLIVVGPPAVQDRFPNLNDMRFAYFSAVSGLAAGSLRDHMQAFFLNPGPTEQRRNLFLNPAGAGAKAWTSLGNAAVTDNGTQVAGGPIANARWRKYTLTEAASGTQVIQLAPADGLLAMPVQPNTQYIVSAYALFSAGTVTNIGLYQLEELDASGGVTSAPFLPTSVVPAAGAWGRDSQLITTAANTAFIRPKMRFLGLNAAIGDYVGVGAVLAEKGSTLRSYFDGGFASCQWVGAADDSASILLG